ncbi:MAG: ATP-binding protein [Thermoanaerobaculia bacterium]
MTQDLNAHAQLFEFAHDSIVLCDAQGVITYWNRGSQRIYGWTTEEALGQKIHSLLKTKFPGLAPDLEETLRTQSHWEGELQQTGRDGRTIQVASHWTLRSDGQDSARLSINTDISARKEAEEDLRRSEKDSRRSEKRFRLFVEEALTGNLLMRPDGEIVICNPAFVRIFDLGSVHEAQRTNFMSLLRSRHDATELIALVQEQRTVERYDLEMRQPSGEPVYVVSRFVGIFNEAGQVVELLGYLFNDTKRKRLEQQLVQAQKMEGLGTLAGGIAHDFNNILAIILGYTAQLEKRPEAIPAATKVIKEAVERGAALVQQLLTSARQAEAVFSSLDLNALVRELERMLQATFPKMINFKLDLKPDFPLVTADRSQIHQVLLNLCVNARDAMPNGGTITVETLLTNADELRKDFTGADARRYVCIRVQDTGGGMTPEVKSHIFEPFFTTKERAKGTGLGLSVVYGVVNNHRGFVQVESEPNVGTTFSVHLPILHGDELTAGTSKQPPTYPREPQTILLVEDEEMLRELGVEVLRAEGYRVLAAKDGLEAVEIFAANRDGIGLVVCDLGLPKLGGRDVFMKMKEIKPSVRAIVASGYLEPSVRSEILKAGVIDTIQKPYDLYELIGKIQAVIGKAQSEDDHPQLF